MELRESWSQWAIWRYIVRTSMALVVFVTAELTMWKVLAHIGRPPDAVEDLKCLGVIYNGVMAVIWIIYLMVLLLCYGRDAMVSVFGLLEASIIFSGPQFSDRLCFGHSHTKLVQ